MASNGFEVYSKRQQFFTDYLPELLARRLEDFHWQTGLELGCGDGSLLKLLEAKGYFHSKQVIALDASPIRLKSAQSVTEHAAVVLGDACHIGIKDNSVDLVITSQVIEHVEDDALMSDEMFRILSNGGLAYISTVYKKRFAWYFYRCNGKWTLDPTHLREYTNDLQLVSKLEKSGFSVLQNYKTADSRPVMDALLRRMGCSRKVYDNKWFRLLRLIRIPIPGYYIWELVCQKT